MTDISIYIDEVINEVNNLHVIIYVNDKERDYDLYIDQKLSEDLVMLEETYYNSRMLSADLRDNIGLGPAADLLKRNNVPRTHPLWDLNHSNLWER